jgi:hypothetical protein
MNAALAEAGRLIEAGRYDQALKLLAPLGDPERFALLGRAWLGRRKAAPALENLKRALTHEPGDTASLLGLAKAHLAGLDAPAAVALLEALSLRAPELAGLSEALAIAYRRDALYERAVALAEAEPHPTPSILYERALCLLMLGRDSLPAFDQLLAIAPNHAAGWFWSHAAAMDDWVDAERRLSKAAAIPGANRKYQGFLAAYDIILGEADPRSCPLAFRHLAEGAAAVRQWCRETPRLFGVPGKLLTWSLAAAKTEGMLCEFGVRRGNSIRQLAAATDQVFHGFDSFIGLPEGWVQAPAGVLTTEGDLPAVPGNVRLYPGWFGDSLPPFLAAHPERLRFANIDCDIYSSTRCVLWALNDRIQSGTILVFDELIGNRTWMHDEFKALTEWASAFSRQFQVIAVNLAGKQVAIQIG